MIKAALYARVSTEEQALHGYSIEAQKEALIEYAKSHNMIIVKIYVDEGISARKKYNRRKDFIQLLEGVRQREFDLILFTKLDRWFRNISDYYKIQEILETHGVNWKTIYENYDTSTASGRLHINIMLSVAQDEADRTSERIKVVFENKIKNKQIITGKLPFGYKAVDKKAVIDEEKAAIVQDIFKYYLEHPSKYGTTRYMNVKYNFKRSYDFYSDILKTDMYTGVFRDVEDYCPAIISKEQFRAVQKIEKKSFVRQNQTKRIYIFSGLIYCHECGHIMSGRQNVTSSNKYLAYTCRISTAQHRCTNKKSIREDYIEDHLLNNLKRLYQDSIISSKMRKESNKRNPLIDKASIKKKMKKLKDLYMDDLIDKNEYRKDYDKYTSMLTEAEETEPVVIYTTLMQKMLKFDFITLYNNLNNENRQIFWREIINEITVDIDKNITVLF